MEECSARSYAELIRSNIPSSSSLLPTRSTASRPSPLSTLGAFSFGPAAATPTRGEILVHLGAASRKPRSVKRKNPSFSDKDRPVPAKVQKLGVSPPSPVRAPGRASPPLADVQNSGASPPSPAHELERTSSLLVDVQDSGAAPPSPAQEPEQALSPLVGVQDSGAAPPSPVQEPEQALPTLDLTLLSPPRPDAEAKGLSGADVAQLLTVLPMTVWNPPSDKAKSPPRRTTELKRKKLKLKADANINSLLSSVELAAGAISSILLESDVGSSKELPVDEAWALSFQGMASVSLQLCLLSCLFCAERYFCV